MRTIDLREQKTIDGPDFDLPRPKLNIQQALREVTPIMKRVRNDGAPALHEYNEKYDGVSPKLLRVPKKAMRDAERSLDRDVRRALRIAIDNTMEAHRAQLPTPVTVEVVPGGKVIQRWVPLKRAGLYVPGGLAVYPSSVVMNVVPALVAGVDSMVVATPPQKEFGGLPHPSILAACRLLGIKEVIAVGGAQAIGAMAYGFEEGEGDDHYVSRPVDKITGPGNIYVAAAKKVAQEVCGTDSEAGTSEIAIIADRKADPRLVAYDLIGQAEHDPAAAAVLITPSASLAAKVQEQLPQLIDKTKHAARVREALTGPQSAMILTSGMGQSIDVANNYAPEHLQIMTERPMETAARIHNAGAIFLGEHSPVPLGDYVGGSNHVLPTGGTARYSSGLNVTEFLKSMQILDYSKDALKAVTPALVAIAEAEGLPAHSEAAVARFEDDELDLDRVRPEDDEIRLPRRAELTDVAPYGAPVMDVPVRLNVNENPFQPDDVVVDAIAEAVRDVASGLNRYSDREAWKLRKALASYLHLEAKVRVRPEQIWAANGSNEIMLQLLQAFGGPGRLALAQWPTYSMYPEYARDTNTEYHLDRANAARKKRNRPPKFNAQRLIKAMRAQRPAVVFVPTPNNPTGSPVSLEDIEEILRAAASTGPTGGTGVGRTASLVVIDEAYAEFRDPGVRSAIELVDRYPNLVVTRTMSKAFAAAGLRLGYMIASREVVDEVQKVRLPYHLSLLTQAAAIATLNHADLQLKQVSLLREERRRLATWLEEKGLRVAPSASNFLLFGRLEKPTEVWQKLADSGVLIREVEPHGYLRVTVGTPEENEAFKEALEEALEETK